MMDNWMQTIAKALSLPSSLLRHVEKKVQHQSDVIKVMTVLSGKYRYEQVDAALNAVGVSPTVAYMKLSANEDAAFLQTFHEALGKESA